MQDKGGLPPIIANGNTTSLRGMTLAYSPDNRLVEVLGAASYVYDGLGQRVQKSIEADASVTNFVFGAGGELIAEADETGAITREYVHLNGQLLAVLDNNALAPDIYYVHNDHLGTPQAMTNELGAVIWLALHDPYGAAVENQDPDLDGISVGLNVRFPGQYMDAETGLHYNYFRDYDPETGRYVESDPIGLGGGLNTYAYVGANPQSKADPYGLCEVGSKTKKCLKEIFGQGADIDGVTIKEYSFYASLHINTLVTTRKNKILLNISCDEFWADCGLVLHEYFHVLRQWNTGQLTVPKYLFENSKTGYWNNKYEVEARQFAAANSEKFKQCKEKNCK